MAFFPNYLKERYKLEQQAKTRTPFSQEIKLIEVIQELRQTNKFWEPHLFLSSSPEITDFTYEICTNKKLRSVLEWISKRIINSAGIDNYITFGVYVRIGTSMLNKLVEEGYLSKESNMYFHDNFVRNLKDLNSYLLDEELPF